MRFLILLEVLGLLTTLFPFPLLPFIVNKWQVNLMLLWLPCLHLNIFILSFTVHQYCLLLKIVSRAPQKLCLDFIDGSFLVLLIKMANFEQLFYILFHYCWDKSHFISILWDGCIICSYIKSSNSEPPPPRNIQLNILIFFFLPPITAAKQWPDL